MHLVDDVDLVARGNRDVFHAVHDFAHVVDAGVAGRIHFDYVDAAVFTDGEARRAGSAGIGGGRGAAVFLAVERARHDPRGGGFAYTANAGQQTRMGQTPGFKSIAQGSDQRVLTDQVESRGTVFPRQNEVLAGFTIDQGCLVGRVHLPLYPRARRVRALPFRWNCATQGGRRNLKGRLERPAPNSLRLLPSGPDRVGERHVRPNLHGIIWSTAERLARQGMNNDDPQKTLSPAHLDRDDPSPSAVPRRTEIRDVDDQTPRAFTGSAQRLSDRPLPYTFDGLDRDGRPQRSAAITAALNSHEAEILPVWRRRVLMSDDGDTLHSWPRDRLNESDPLVFLGLRDGTPYFAADISAHENPETEGARAQFIDPWMVGPNLDPFLAGVGAYARHLLAWHRSSRFCGRCGSRRSRPCRAGTPLHQHRLRRGALPASIRRRSCWCRTPAGSAASWPAITTSRRRSTRSSRAMSTRGETLEQTVVREVAEEVGLRIGRVRYAASQPGPSATR